MRVVEGRQAGSDVFSQVLTQNSFATLAGDDDEEEEEEAGRREAKRINEEGGRREGRDDDARSQEQDEIRRRREEKDKEVCKAFKFGGKCPHGMNGLRKHNQFDNCNRSHPKVCNKLLNHGIRGAWAAPGGSVTNFIPKCVTLV